MKFIALAEPAALTLEAADPEDARLKAFALYIARLSPTFISVEPARERDPWLQVSHSDIDEPVR